MNFEVVGVHPANKGALLMLEAIQERLTEAYPAAKFAVPYWWPTELRLQHRLWFTSAPGGARASIVRAFGHAPVRFQRALGFIPAGEIDVLLDASGFGYGDFWGLPKLRDRLANRLREWKRNGKKAVLLPQALGPFEKPGMAETFRDALDRLDLAFVRDNESWSYVEAVAPGRAHVQRAPDFTNLLKPLLPQRLADLRGLPAIVPNEKMVTGRSEAERARYFEFLKEAIETLRASGREPFLLLHEGAEDRNLAEAVNASLGKRVRVVDEKSPLVTKALIGATELVISSRFHALVSALSAGVPALACGWSHKYRELMADYACADLNVDIGQRESWRPQIERLLACVRDEVFRSRLQECASAEREKTERMWDSVIKVLG